MALRFRTRLNLTIASLVFIVVTVMTLVVLFIYVFDIWRQGWSQGTYLTQVTTLNIGHGLTAAEQVERAFQEQMIVQGMLVSELVSMADQSPGLSDRDVAAALQRVRARSDEFQILDALPVIVVSDEQGAPLLSSEPDATGSRALEVLPPEFPRLSDPDADPLIVGDSMIASAYVPVVGTDETRIVRVQARSQFGDDSSTDYSPQALIERFMIPDLYKGIAVITAEGEIVAHTGEFDLDSNFNLQRRIVTFSQAFLKDVPEDRVSFILIGSDGFLGRDLGVVTPLQEQDGEYTHALFVLHNVSQQMTFILNRVGVVITVGFLLFMMALIVSIFVSRGLSKPLIILAKGAREFGAGNLNYRLRMRRKDEFNDLAQSFNTMAISIQEYVHELEQETSRRERLESEFRIAAELQRILLPEAPPELEGLTLVGWSQPSKEVGGDFYDFIELDDGKVAVVLGDATGKGLPAALLSTQCASILRTLAGQNLNPGELLYRTNNEFFRQIGTTHRFVTLFLMIVDTKKGTASYSSAGHPPPLLIHAKTGETKWLESEAGYPLGIVNEATFSESTIHFDADDTVVIYSDGLTDAQNHSNELYGEERIEESLRNVPKGSCEDVLENLRRGAEKHMDGKDPTDDMTLVVIRYQSVVPAKVSPVP